FGDELGREVRLELRLVLERIVALGVRHGAAFEPTVENLRDATPNLTAAFARNGDLVHEMLVEVGDAGTGALLQLADAADAHIGLASFAAPNRQGRAPVAVARDRPIAGVFQPVAETAVAQMRRHPANALV